MFSMETTICIGHILLFAGNFAPVGWLPCDGRKLLIREHMALYSIIGDTYGGDGRTEFSLPKFPNMQQAIYIIAIAGQFPRRP
jgi:microcystin-dependent protein